MTAAATRLASPRRRSAARRTFDKRELWGRAFVLPYLLFFAVFVLYPVGYGLWLARSPQSYVKLFDDPIFFRTAINTVVFVVVAMNLKMAIALGLSGFFVQHALVDQDPGGALHPAVGGAVDPDDPVGALHAQPRVGRDQQHLLPPHRARRAELAQRPDAGADASRC